MGDMLLQKYVLEFLNQNFFNRNTVMRLSYNNMTKCKIQVNNSDPDTTEKVNVCSSSVSMRLTTGFAQIPFYDIDYKDKDINKPYFSCNDRRVVGIAGGILGWGRISGIPFWYPEMLMFNAKRVAESILEYDFSTPTRIVQNAFLNTIVQSSCAICVLVLRNEHLYASTCGYSGFMIFRGDRLLFRSPIENISHQISTFKVGLFDNKVDTFAIRVSPGDIIVAGSSGLWNNLYLNHVRDLIRSSIHQGMNLWETAGLIASLIVNRTCALKYSSPFSPKSKSGISCSMEMDCIDETICISLVDKYELSQKQI